MTREKFLGSSSSAQLGGLIALLYAALLLSAFSSADTAEEVRIRMPILGAPGDAAVTASQVPAEWQMEVQEPYEFVMRNSAASEEAAGNSNVQSAGLPIIGATEYLADTLDSLDWRGYFPLAIGNEWEYRDTTAQCRSIALPCTGRGNTYLLRAEGEVVIEGRSFFMLVRYHRDARIDTLHVRYDEDTASVLVRSPDETERCFGYNVLCELDRSVGTAVGTEWPEGTGSPPRTYLPLSLTEPPPRAAEIPLHPDIRGKNVRGQFFDIGDFLKGRLVHGIGPTYLLASGPCGKCPFGHAVLRYARIDGITYGSPSIEVPTSVEPDPEPMDIDVWPNPSQGRIMIRPAVPGTIVVFDLQGREVLQVASPAGTTEAIDLHGLPSGIYFVRVGSQMRPIVIL